MKYEEFAARAKSCFDDCSEMKRMLWNMQSVVGSVPDMVRKNERLDRERAELKAEIERLKSEVPDDCMRLPLDADGVPIRLDDTVWYVGPDVEITNDDPQQVVGLVTVFAADGIYVMTRDFTDKAIRPNMLTHKQPEPPDSWEKLEEDAKKSACRYFYGPEEIDIVSCMDCKHSYQATGRPCRVSMNIELMKRAKRLAGIEEEAQR